MKNIEAGVGAVPTQEKKEKVEGEGKKYIRKENEVIFCLEEAPEYQISAVGKWYENSHGEVIGDVDTYFLHILTNQRCENVRDCFGGWLEQDTKSAEQWETLCERIENLGSIEEYIANEKRVEV